MRAFLQLMLNDLRLAVRDRMVLFFNYLFPLLFFFIFASVFRVAASGQISFVVSMVLVLGILGNGLFGAGMHIVHHRETNILRRFKVAPLHASQIVLSTLVTGWILYLPAVALLVGLAMLIYDMPRPTAPLSLLVVITAGVLAFRGLGLILAAVANSMQEVNVLIQLIYMPMLFLTGAMFPLTLLPVWVQLASQFLPATYLTTAVRGVLMQNETWVSHPLAVAALLVTTLLGVFISAKLFRWEREDKVPLASKLWVVAVLVPFLVLGAVGLHSRDQVRRAQVLDRLMARRQTLLIRGARVFVGDGSVIESGSVLVKNGRIVQVVREDFSLPRPPGAEVIDASGKTLLPGLIDTHAHISVSGTMSEDFESSPLKGMAKSLATQLYCGVTTVRSVGDSLSLSLQLRREIDGGERLGAELFVCGPMFTAKGGHGTEYFEKLPEGMRELAQSEVVRLPTSPAEAKRQVGELKSAGVDGVKVILEKGFGQSTFPRLERAAFLAIAEAARGQGLPLVVHTGEMADIEEALAAGAATIEHGSSRQKVPDEVLAALASRGIAYDPTLAVLEGLAALMKGDESSLGRGLATRVVSAGQRQQLRTNLGRLRSQIATEAGDWLEKGRLIASDNLLRAEQLRVPLIAGSDAGNPLVTQGPGLHRELRLWVEVGIKPTVALKAATSGAARALRAGHRIGLIKPGFEANLLLVEGNPLEDISATERIALVLFRGGRVNRPALLDGDVR